HSYFSSLAKFETKIQLQICSSYLLTIPKSKFQRFIMKYSSLFFLFFVLTIACSSDPSQSAFPKNIPVDNRPEHQVDQATILAAQVKKSVQTAQEIEDQRNDGSLSNYVTRDGVAPFVAESTTYYKEAGKVTPVKTSIIYLTGDAANVYWLADKFVLLSKNDYQYLFKNSVLIASLKEETPVEIGETDRKAATKTLNIAQQIISAPIPTNE
ncbi:MAG: Unknown protein, partial [uncultured Aureispira sp.]